MPGKKSVRLPNRRRRVSVTGYKGVVEINRGHWYACVSRQGRKYTLGTFDCRHEAALAVNIGTVLLFPGVPNHYQNTIPPDHLPSAERAVTIRQEVTCRLASYGLAIAEPHGQSEANPNDHS